MSDFLSMGGYGFYVWSSYGLFAAMLVWDLLAPRLRERATLRQLALKQRRDAARRNKP